MPPQADNPEGFWEHLGFVAVNDEVLGELGGAWDLPPKPNEDFAAKGSSGAMGLTRPVERRSIRSLREKYC